ncbi:MAG: hypothetical protein ACRD0H_11650 [Actinomycetes bacterium]
MSDDELYAVQGRYLGPAGHTIPWHARYCAYALWAVYAVGLLIVRAQLHVLPGGGGYVTVAAVATIATVVTMRVVTPERPITAVARMAWAELRAPRPASGRGGVRAAPDPGRVLVSRERPRPRSRRNPR